MKLSVIIVNYNVKHFLRQTLLSVRKAIIGIDADIWVVDNTSIDGSQAMVRDEFPEVKLIANAENVGFSKANNQAISRSAAEYVLILNPDTVVREDTFSICLDFMDNTPNAGAVGVKMIDGSGKFLPESKRGFPSPRVAFFKAFGFSKIFRKSKLFNYYHLGHLSENENHEVDVLSGAFMLIRKKALDKIGAFDEDFFMYGEDIDLSYRITLGGYKNFYIADTSIIHYKGESTKKATFNYVKTFYNAMIIFAQKHLKGSNAKAYVGLIRLAVFLRAFITVIKTFLSKFAFPLLDSVLVFSGFYITKEFWARHYFNNPFYYSDPQIYINLFVYTGILLISNYINGAYDKKYDLLSLIKGLFLGFIVLAAFYGFVEEEYRFSRMVLLLGTVLAAISSVISRVLIHFLEYKTIDFSQSRRKNVLIVGSEKEAQRVNNLISVAVPSGLSIIGYLSSDKEYNSETQLGSLQVIEEVTKVLNVNEIIFCAKDLSAKKIIELMTSLGQKIEYRIVPDDTMSIIGSSSSNEPGELYTVEIKYDILLPENRRKKRLFDLAVFVVLVLFAPILVLFQERKMEFIKSLILLFLGKMSFVGYISRGDSIKGLPEIKNGILTPVCSNHTEKLESKMLHRINFIYSKDYNIYKDIKVFFDCFPHFC